MLSELRCDPVSPSDVSPSDEIGEIGMSLSRAVTLKLSRSYRICLSWFALLLTRRCLSVSCSFIYLIDSYPGRELSGPKSSACRRSAGSLSARTLALWRVLTFEFVGKGTPPFDRLRRLVWNERMM